MNTTIIWPKLHGSTHQQKYHNQTKFVVALFVFEFSKITTSKMTECTLQILIEFFAKITVFTGHFIPLHYICMYVNPE